MRNRIAFVLSFVALTVLLTGLGWTAEKTLKAVCFIPKNHPLVSQTLVWVDMVNGELKGKVKINYVGGPEVIPGLQQVEALRKGVVDITFSPTAYYQSIFPEGVAFTLSKLTPTEERAKNGFYDYMFERHKRINAAYLGRWLWSPFYLWVNKDVKKLSDLKGMKLRTTALYDRFMKAIGIVPVQVSAGETYTALERGTVDGFGWPLLGARSKGWTKKAGYIIDHPFYNQNCTILMNLDTWKKLDPAIQKKIVEVTTTFEPKMVEHFKAANAKEWTELGKAGVKKVKFSPPEAKKYLGEAYAVEWEQLSKKVPKLIPDLKRVTGN